MSNSSIEDEAWNRGLDAFGADDDLYYLPAPSIMDDYDDDPDYLDDLKPDYDPAWDAPEKAERKQEEKRCMVCRGSGSDKDGADCINCEGNGSVIVE